MSVAWVKVSCSRSCPEIDVSWAVCVGDPRKRRAACQQMSLGVLGGKRALLRSLEEGEKGLIR